jgi:Fe-S cluster assembly protein SufB
MSTSTETIEQLANREYKYGFVTDVETETIPKGLSEDIVRLISQKKNEPQWLLEWRLKAYRLWLTMKEPTWQNVKYDPINYQDIVYYSAPKKKKALNSLDEVDPEVKRTFDKLGIPLEEQKLLAGVAVDAVFDSVSVATTFRDKLASMGIIFMSFSEAVHHHPELVQKYLGSVVPHTDNFFAALNSAVFSDGSFVYVPKGVKCPMELSTYFRPISASTRKTPDSSSGRSSSRTRARRSATSKAAPRRCATKTSCTRRSSSWSRTMTRRSSTRRSRTGIPATRKARAGSTTS